MKGIPSWFSCIVKIIKSKNANNSLTSIQTLIKFMIKSNKDPIYLRLCNLIVDEAKMKNNNNNSFES